MQSQHFPNPSHLRPRSRHYQPHPKRPDSSRDYSDVSGSHLHHQGGDFTGLRWRFPPASGGGYNRPRVAITSGPCRETTPCENGVPVRGSSPPARGRVDAALDAVETAGFIPACAGESCAGRLPPCGPGVHPRLRGGETAMHAAAASAGGSSPPARGRGASQPRSASR